MIFSYQIAFDTADPFELSVFWSRALGLRPPTREEVDAFHTAHPDTVGRGVVQDPAWRHPRIYIQTVPEPKVGTNRVRFEVARDADELVGYGAETVDGEMLRDPGGNEFTVVDGDQPRFMRIVIDALDPAHMATFWSEVLGFERTADGLRASTEPAAPVRRHADLRGARGPPDVPGRVGAAGRRDAAPHAGAHL